MSRPRAPGRWHQHAQSRCFEAGQGAGAGPLASCLPGWPWRYAFLTETVGEPVAPCFVRENNQAPAASCCCEIRG